MAIRPKPTEEEFQNILLDALKRDGTITTRRIFDATYEMAFYMEYYLGRKEAARQMNNWINNFVEPIDIEKYLQTPTPDSRWRLKANDWE